MKPAAHAAAIAARVRHLSLSLIVLAVASPPLAATDTDKSLPSSSNQTVVRAAPSVDERAVAGAWERFDARQSVRWNVTWNELTRHPLMMTGAATRSYGGAPEPAAQAFVNENRALFGLTAAETELVVEESKSMPKIERVTLRQRYAGLDVFDGTIHVMVDRGGRIHHVTNNSWPVSAVDFSRDVGETGVQARIQVRFPGATIAPGETPRRVIYPSGNGVLAYAAYVRAGEPQESWLVVVDAATGVILEERRLILEERPASGEAEGSGSGTLLSPADACDREWTTFGTVGEVSVVEVPNPTDPYEVDVTVGVTSVGALETDNQFPGKYGAGIKLLPCIKYTITVTYGCDTWGQWNGGGLHDVFFVQINSANYYWNLGGAPATEHFCSSELDTLGTVLQGKSWTGGGDACADMNLCSLFGQFQLEYMEPDSTKDVYLSVGMERFQMACPSWGRYRVKIEAKSYVFDPNPVTTKNQVFTDQADANSAVPCDAYFKKTLTNLTNPGAGNPWSLKGDYAEIKNIENPATGYATAREPHFPYLRRCDMFEAVMCYYHITQNQLYVQALGFNAINNRQHPVDAHGLNGADNSYYTVVPPTYPSGTGYLAFGEGGIDDAEDADVVIHEYGHSIQDNTTPGTYFGNGNNGFGNETRAMGEGFGDYWACSAFEAANTASGFDPAVFAEFDAQNANGLRKVNKNKKYPNDMQNQVHRDGEIWSRTLWDLFQNPGKAVADFLVLESHYFVPNNPKFTDAAKAILFADFFDFGGANRERIIDVYVDRGIFRRLQVASSPQGVQITVDKADCRGDQDGTTQFDRVYAYGDTVRLEAPSTLIGYNFVRWIVDGANLALDDTVTTVVMDHTPDNHLAVAIYEQPVPVAISRLDAVERAGVVELSWDVVVDEAFDGFRVYRAAGTGEPGTLIALNDAMLAGDVRSYRDASVVPGMHYAYVVAAVLPGGGEIRSAFSRVRVSPLALSLEQNHPNPFNPSTVIAYTLPEAVHVELVIYDVQGRMVRVLRSSHASAGRHEVDWDGTNASGEPVSSGLYFYRLKAGKEVLTRRMVLLK
jgi:hypothetical protein